MPPRQFPFPFKVGTDICSVQRIFRIIAEHHIRPSRFVRRILTPHERQAKGGATWKSLQTWRMLQNRRKQLGAGIQACSPNSAHDYAIYAGPFISHHQSTSKSPWNQSYGQPTSDDLSASSIKDTEAEGGDVQEGTPTGNIECAVRNENTTAAEVGPAKESFTAAAAAEYREALHEATSTGNLESAGGEEYTHAAKSTISKEPSIAATEAFCSEEPVGSVAQNAPIDENITISQRNTPVHGAEASAINNQQQKKSEDLSRSSQLEYIEEEMEKIYPDILDTAEFLAGRFSAKEAVIKAYENRRLTYQDIQILAPQPRNGISGKPIMMVISEDGDWDDAQIVPLSISHDGGFATAMCMVYEESPGAVFETVDDIYEALGRRRENKDKL